MKRTYSDERQDLYTDRSHTYSIVNLHRMPGREVIGSELVDHFEKLMANTYPAPYEVADITTDEVKILGRFESGEEAIEYLHQLHKKREES